MSLSRHLPEVDVAIVGGGPAGALTAIALARTAPLLQVAVVEPAAHLGTGRAFATADERHLLNVAAGAMSALPDEPDHLVAWAHTAGEGGATPRTFLPRGLYGRYLADTVSATAPELVHVRGAVSSLGRRGQLWQLRLDDGRTLSAQAAVLALGGGAACDPPGLPDAVAADVAYVRDPWSDAALAAVAGGPVLCIGTGLTAVDVALTLARHPRSTVVAVSRHGLRPLAHRAEGAPTDLPPLPIHPPTALGMLRAVRSQVALGAQEGWDWRDVVNRIRPSTAAMWHALPHAERRRFAHRLARFWEVHRHRMAPEIADQLDALETAGRFEVVAGSVASAERRGGVIRVTLAVRGGGSRTLEVSGIVNCTGTSLEIRHNPLLARLESRGWCAPGPLGLGVATGPDGEVLDRDGRAAGLYTLGALRRGELWETTAIPEIRDQAGIVAARLAKDLGAPGRLVRLDSR